MKYPYFKSLSFRIIAIIAIAVSVILIHSCKKEKADTKNPVVTLNDPTISKAKQWYDSVYTQVNNAKQATQSSGQVGHDLSKKFLPNWAKASTFTRDGVTYIEISAIKNGDMAMTFSKPDTAHFDFSRSGTLTNLVIVKDQSSYSLYAMSILADSSYLNGDYSKLFRNSYQQLDTNFTGAIFFKKMDGTFVNGWRYLDGRIVRTLSPVPDATTTQTIQSVSDSKLKVNLEQACGAIIGVTVYEDCWYVGSQSTCAITSVVDVMEDCPPISGGDPSGPGSPPGGSTPSPCNPTAPPANSSINTGHLTVNKTMPPPGGGNPAPCPPVTTIITTVDPCAQLASIIAAAQNTKIKSANQQIYNDIGTGHEYGNEDNLTSWPNGTYMTTPIRTDFNDTQFTPNFTWDSTNGYTINISHDHPGGSAPSPADVLQLVNNAVNNSNLKAAGSAALDYYKKNASITVITADATYVVTIADYNALASVSTTQSLNDLTGQFQNLITNNNGSFEYALLSIFGKSINFYKSSANGTDFSPLAITNNKLTKINCIPN